MVNNNVKPIISALYSNLLYTDLQMYWPPEDMWSSLVLGLPAVAGTLLEKHMDVN